MADKETNRQKEKCRAMAGMDLIVTKWVALEGTAELAREREAKLLQVFPRSMVETAKGFARYMAEDAEAAIARAQEAAVIKEAAEGGIFGALWELGEESRVGMEIIAKDIPIRQETIEIAEYYGLHPYKLKGAGSFLIAAADGTGLIWKLKEAGIPASIIGKVTAGNDRIIYTDGVKRYLEPVRLQ